MKWTVKIHKDAESELGKLPVGLRARLFRLMELIEEHGLENVGAPHVKHIEGKIWELRAKAKEGIARGLYVTLSGREVVVLRVFQKKQQKLPPRELKVARERMKEIK